MINEITEYLLKYFPFIALGIVIKWDITQWQWWLTVAIFTTLMPIRDDLSINKDK